MVSVVLPCYNCEKTIVETLESINNQVYESFQLVIIDDGSSDSTKKIIERFPFSPNVDVILVSRPNKGFLPTMIELVNLAKGDFLARIDADDVWESNHLSLLMNEFLQDPNLVLIGSNANIIDSKGKFLSKTNFPLTKESILKRFLNDNPFIHSSVIFKKSVYSKTCGYLCGDDDKSTHIADYNLWLEMSKLGNIKNLSEATLSYRYQSVSLSRNINRKRNYQARLWVMNKAYKMYGQHTFYYLLNVLKVRLRIAECQMKSFFK